MAKAAPEQKTAGPASGAAASPATPRSWLPVHKPGEGTITRLSLFAVATTFGLYSAHCWYYNWTAVRNFLIKNFLDPVGAGFLLNWSLELGPAKAVSLIGSMVLLLGGLLAAYYFLYVHVKTSEFLVQTDGELRKVTWPKVVPWFKPETQVWGATYVVLLVVVFLAVYVFAVDTVFNLLAQFAFYGD